MDTRLLGDRGRRRLGDAANDLLQVISEFLATNAVQKEIYSTVGYIEFVTHFRNEYGCCKFGRSI